MDKVLPSKRARAKDCTVKAARIDEGGYLGILCRRKHDHNGTGMSWRQNAGHCVACVRESYLKRMQDPEKIALRSASNQKFRDRNHKSLGEKRRAAYHKNHAKSLAYSAKARAENIERARETDKKCKKKLRYEKPEKTKSYARNYYAKNSVRIRIRNRISKAIRQQRLEKKLTIAGYGIDIGAIAEFLGPCPGNPSDWHIDHIRPLSSFDLSDLSQIKEAFRPTNHQWLTARENLIKAAKYG